MKFGIMLDPHVDKWPLAQRAEELGYDTVWVPDSQMIWSDTYVTMALIASKTKRIRIGTGITSPGTRTAPVTANAIGSLNRVAPGRIFLGIGTGHTALRLMGQPPVQPKEFREYIRVVRDLLDGKAVDYTQNGRTAEIKFMHRHLNYMNLDNHIPILVAANGPKAITVAGEYGDGWIVGGGMGPAEFKAGYQAVRDAAKAAGRTLPANFQTVNVINGCVMRPGDKLTDERVIKQTGTLVTANLHFIYEIWERAGRPDGMIPPHFAAYWDDFVKRVDSIPEKIRYRVLHDGHATYLQEEERKFVTPAAITASSVVGEPDEIVERLRAFAAAGLTDVCLMPSAETQVEMMEDFAKFILPRFR